MPALNSTVPDLHELSRHPVDGDDPSILADVYESNCNIAIWRRALDTELAEELPSWLESNRRLQAAMMVAPERAFVSVFETLGESRVSHLLSENIAELVDMFCYLFELKQAGLRLTVLDRAMCPKFHVDRVPCRLVTTFCGTATEWLPHDAVDRSKLGRGSHGLTDEESGLFQSTESIQKLNPGDVALLKGELWEGNEGAGLVHRSPAVQPDERRLLLTLDFG